ncbi:MAG: 50S ribosomal protein L10 [Spirochaetes bacterium]|nr:50S ribosomal protein L10 [Spirochaetota bacterium]
MVKQYKIDQVDEIVSTLKNNKNFILTHYSGVKVAALTELRSEIRKSGGKYKVVKNNLFRKALSDTGYAPIDNDIKGPIGVVFAGEQIGEVAKKLKDFKKDQEVFDYFLGVIDEVIYDQSSLNKIADLPSKEALLAQIMSMINGPARSIATGSNQIIASLARAINAVADKNK